MSTLQKVYCSRIPQGGQIFLFFFFDSSLLLRWQQQTIIPQLNTVQIIPTLTPMMKMESSRTASQVVALFVLFPHVNRIEIDKITSSFVNFCSGNTTSKSGSTCPEHPQVDTFKLFRYSFRCPFRWFGTARNVAALFVLFPHGKRIERRSLKGARGFIAAVRVDETCTHSTTQHERWQYWNNRT